MDSPGTSKSLKRFLPPLLTTPPKKSKSISGWDFLEKNKTDLGLLARSGSKFVTYKEPQGLYQNLLNMAGVAQMTKRNGKSEECKLEAVYKKLKEEDYPANKLDTMMLKALSNIDLKKQKTMKDFFGSGESVQKKPINPFFNSVTVSGSDESSEDDDDKSEDDEEDDDNYDENKTTFFQLLAKSLKLPARNKLRNKSKTVEESCGSMYPLVNKFLELKQQTDSKSKHEWMKSKLKRDTREGFQDIDVVRELLLKIGRLQYNLDSKDIDDMEANIVNTKIQLQDCESELSVASMFVITKFPQFIISLGKRSSAQNVAEVGVKPIEVNVKNANVSWDDMLNVSEDRYEGLTVLTRDEHEKLKNVFNIQDVDYYSPIDLCKYLGKENSEAKNLLKLIVKYLPVMVIKKMNRKMVMGSNKLMDANFIVDLYKLDGNKTNEADFVKVFQDVRHVEKTGSRGHKKAYFSDNKELIDGIKDFVTESGVAANDRRRTDCLGHKELL